MPQIALKTKKKKVLYSSIVYCIETMIFTFLVTHVCGGQQFVQSTMRCKHHSFEYTMHLNVKLILIDNKGPGTMF